MLKSGRKRFWHDFLPISLGNELITSLKTRNLAYIALLAGWICFSYWLYAEQIAPRLQENQKKFRPSYVENLEFPLGFTWGSDLPLSGDTFGELKATIERIDSTDELIIVSGYYFRDEAEDAAHLRQLATRRINNTLHYLNLNKSRMMVEVGVQEITADVRTIPFEAVKFERLHLDSVIHESKDTIEICFPFKDSLILPQICIDRLAAWIGDSEERKERIMHITGTADGSGIAEPADMAMDRAERIRNIVLQTGWNPDQIALSTGQRNLPLTLRNRCAVIYFE
jgi:hypothetical protein